MAVSKFYPTPLTPPNGSKVKYSNFAITKAVTVVNIFAEILHAGRGVIDMEHIKEDFSLKAWIQFPGVDLGGGVKIVLFINMFMLHIKLKLTMHAAT